MVNMRRSQTRSPVPSPSPIRKYLSVDSVNCVDKESCSLSPDLDGKNDGRDEGPSSNGEVQGLEVQNERCMPFQDAVIGTGTQAASGAIKKIAIEKTLTSGGETEPNHISDETAELSKLSSLGINKSEVNIVDGLSSNEEDVVEMGPENVKIHESVIPQIKISNKSSYYTAATSLENEVSWAKDTKMKVTE